MRGNSISASLVLLAVLSYGVWLNSVLERLAFEQFHRNEGLTLELVDVLDRADVRMIEGGSGLGFTLESLQRAAVPGRLLRQELWGGDAVKPAVRVLVNDAHASSAEFFKDPVTRDDFADHGECLHWQCAHCNLKHLKVPTL